MATEAVGLRRGIARRAARGGGALALLASTALVALGALGASEARAQAGPSAQPVPQPQPQSQPEPRIATRNVSGLVFLDDPTKVRPGGWTGVAGIDASKAPSFARSGAFDTALKPFLGQGIANATLNLSPTLSGFAGVAHGTGIKLTGANHIGGTLALKTGNLALKAAQETDFNLVQSAAVNLSGKTLLVEANTGTAFGGSNTLNAGIGSTVTLGSGTNGFGTLTFSNVSNTTVDGTGGIVIGASTFNGDFAVSLTGSGGIVTTGAILADNHLGPNSASVTFSDTGAGISIGGGIAAGTLNLTGNGTIVQTAGVLALAGDLNVTDLAAGDATLTGNTAAGGSGTLALGNSSVTGNLVLTSNSLLQTGGSTLVVGGDLDLTNVGSSTFNGTVIVGNNLLGTHPVAGGTIAVGGLNSPQLAQGTIAPTFNNISGTTFRPTQGMVDSASAGVGAGGTVTVQLFGAVADHSLSATHGAGIMLNQGGNVIGGTARIKTGNGTLTANASSLDVNLGQVGALSFSTKALILAHAGTLFGGPSALNTGHGATVQLNSIGNHFTSVALQDVSDSTLDGSGGVTLGFGSQVNTVHGNLLVSMASSGGISLATDLVASNVTSGSTLANSALVSLDASNGDIGLSANLTAGSLGLRGNGTISQSPGSGTLAIAGNVTVVDLAAGDASVSATAALGLILGDSAVVGTLNVSAGGSLPLTLAPGATLQAANGDIVLTGQLGYELRPALQARVEGTSAEALAGIEPGGPGAFSCARLPETLALLAENPELAQHLRDLCAHRDQRDLPEVPRYFRPMP